MRRGAIRCSVAAVMLLAACQNLEATVYNFRELHPAPGRHAHAARTMGAGYYTFRASIQSALAPLGASLEPPDPHAIEDPTESCMQLLTELRGMDGDSFGIRSTQVELFVRAALYDPWVLSRKTAVEELGRAAEALGTARRERYAIADPQPDAAALEALKSRLVAAGLAYVESDTPEAQSEFAEACSAALALGLAEDGALELLADINTVLRSAADSDPRMEPMRKLALALQDRLIDIALARALNDKAPSGVIGSDPGWPHPMVQAAAVHASVQAFGAPRLAEILLMNPFRQIENERLIAVLAEIERRSLPPATPEQTERLGGDAQRYWTAAIVTTAAEHPDGRVRQAAMKALGKISGKGLFSMRFDDWYTWWQGRSGHATEAAKDSEP